MTELKRNELVEELLSAEVASSKSETLLPIKEKVARGERISDDDAAVLLNSDDIVSIGEIADIVRRRKNSDNTFYIINRHINYTNVCKNECSFCAYYRSDKEDGGAFTLTLDQIKEKAEEGVKLGVSEFHVVGALNDELPFSYYVDMLKTIKSVAPSVHIQAFTAVEIDYIASVAKMSLEDTIDALKNAGLDSVPGGGAEIFDEDVRNAICGKKISGERWLEVSRAVHNAGLHSNATMLFGHAEKDEHIVDHLRRLRELQDETNGFLSFIPLAFHPNNTEYEGRYEKPSNMRMLKMLSLARIYLDNFPHIKAFWIMLGLPLAFLSQHFGVDDVDGTVEEERITHSAGAVTPEKLSRAELEERIVAMGFCPVERDTVYNRVER